MIGVFGRLGRVGVGGVAHIRGNLEIVGCLVQMIRFVGRRIGMEFVFMDFVVLTDIDASILESGDPLHGDADEESA